MERAAARWQRGEGEGDVREARETNGRRQIPRQVAQPGNRQKRANGLTGLSGLAGFSGFRGGIRIVAAIVRGRIRRIHHGRLLHGAMRLGQGKVRISLKGNRNG